VNPEGDHAYLKSQTGNTRFYPVEVTDINIDDVQTIREQLFAEALDYYRTHPNDWWQLSAEGERQARDERERRRQRGVYEDSLQNWLDACPYTEVWWELIAEEFLTLPKDRWSDRRAQMEVAKSLGALGWRKQSQKTVTHKGKMLRARPWTK
jgi:predicted P-loop ATPase